jgi:hypothetical protein
MGGTSTAPPGDETWVSVPGLGAAVEDLLRFAGTYDAYEFMAAEPDRLASLFGALYDDLTRTLIVPEWVRVDLARAVLFYAYRVDYFSGGGGPYEPMAALVEHIRSLSGGWVPLRSQPAHTPAELVPEPVESPVDEAFVDSWEYSDDRVYRWWYERRWKPGPSLCFVGLNPATGDTDGKPRPTLAKVVKWAKREGCSAVVVVNLFAFRATNPQSLFTAGVDIVGEGNDEVIRQRSSDARITLVAWGAHRLAKGRADEVLPLLQAPRCIGVTKSGAPAHPLYVPSSRPFQPY